jgi:transposase
MQVLEHYWNNHWIRNSKYESYLCKKKFFDRKVSFLRKTCSSIVIGDYKNIKGMKYGKQKPPIQYFIDTCKRNHLSIKEQKEFNTSKLCCYCGNVLRNYNAKTKEAIRYINARKSKFAKLKYCEYSNHVINRDVNASINLVRIAEIERKNGCQSSIFSRNNQTKK